MTGSWIMDLNQGGNFWQFCNRSILQLLWCGIEVYFRCIQCIPNMWNVNSWEIIAFDCWGHTSKCTKKIYYQQTFPSLGACEAQEQMKSPWRSLTSQLISLVERTLKACDWQAFDIVQSYGFDILVWHICSNWDISFHLRCAKFVGPKSPREGNKLMWISIALDTSDTQSTVSCPLSRSSAFPASRVHRGSSSCLISLMPPPHLTLANNQRLP
jgi:hypothetical protein